MKLLAYAKINLFLHIIGKYDNGYHRLESLFSFCEDLYDEINIKPSNDLSVKITKSPFPEALSIRNEDNLVYKILNALGIKFDIEISKNIPIGAGLGGGSCDAAAMLNYLEKNKIPFERNLVSKFGADIAVCMEGRTCFATGIGDEIIARPKLPELYALLVKPNYNISTIDIYKKSVTNFVKPLGNIDWNLSNIDHFIEFIKQQKNSLLEPILYYYPQIAALIDDIASTSNCIYANVSGSGSCCFGLYKTRNNATLAGADISTQNNHIKTYITKIC